MNHRSDIEATLLTIRKQIAAVIEDTRQRTGSAEAVYSELDRNGRPILTKLLLAKSNCLLALTNLDKK